MITWVSYGESRTATGISAKSQPCGRSSPMASSRTLLGVEAVGRYVKCPRTGRNIGRTQDAQEKCVLTTALYVSKIN